MNIVTAYTAQGYLGAHALPVVNSENDSREATSESRPTGDSVVISDDALEMLARAVENSDTAGDREENGFGQEGNGSTGAPASGASGAAAAGNSAVEEQIKNLQGQLAALLNQLSVGPNTTMQGKIASIQAKIAALQAQLT
ncbi:MAG: FlxA-like family protein [Desulfovibrio sp.]|nr:FlxA-like family protein [Desulfovibrio sp.]